VDIALRVTTFFVAAVFAFAGALKASRPKERLAADMPGNMDWVEDFSQPTVRLVGLLEVVGAAVLVLTLLLDVAPVLAAVAASGLAVTMVLAALVHARRGERQLVVMPLVLGALSVFVAVARLIQ
jgi:uncharacterized membrane protein YphA (DoxX/SURF4 family)